MRSRITPVAGAAALAAILLAFVPLRGEAGLAQIALRSRCRKAAARALEYYRSLNPPELSPNDFFMLRQIAARDRAFAETEVYTNSEQRVARLDLPYRRLFDPDYVPPDLGLARRPKDDPAGGSAFYDISPPYRDLIYNPRDEVFLKALFCDYTGYDAEDFAYLLSTVRGLGDYNDTHALSSLLLLRVHQCYGRKELDEQIDRLALILAEAAGKTETVNDVDVERIVYLYWAGYGRLVKPEWIEKVLAAQSADGGWGASEGSPSNAHMTGLAVLSLLYWADGKEAQPCLGVSR